MLYFKHKSTVVTIASPSSAPTMMENCIEVSWWEQPRTAMLPMEGDEENDSVASSESL